MLRKLLLANLFLLLWFFTTSAQELNAKISVLSNRIAQVDKNVFTTLQSALNDFLNNRKWTNEVFQPREKISCNFLLNLSAGSDNIYTASLIIQAARPVYNSSYLSPLMSYQDESVTFRYIQFQSLDFNESRVQGSEPLAANLTAVFAYYVYIILGLNFDSFALRGGDPYFQKALYIVNNAPEGTNLSGWKPFDATRDRFWLADNLTNSKYTQLHDAFYDYFRRGLDQMYEKEDQARQGIMACLSILNTINQDNPNLMIMQFFFQGRATEISNIFKRATPDEKTRAVDYLTKLDITNINRYKQDLQ
ncbi:MAG: DUF4835 family protein [Chitinophagales bacterium]